MRHCVAALPRYVRVNTLKTTVKAAVEQFQADGFVLKTVNKQTYSKYGLIQVSGFAIHKHTYFTFFLFGRVTGTLISLNICSLAVAVAVSLTLTATFERPPIVKGFQI